MTEKTFNVAGVSNLNGMLKVRFANGLDRVKTLMRNGHTDIELFEFPEADTKAELIDKLLQVVFVNPEYADVVKRTAVEKYGYIIPGYEAKKVDKQVETLAQSGGALVVYGAVQAAVERIVPQRINGRFAKKQVREAAMMALLAA